MHGRVATTRIRIDGLQPQSPLAQLSSASLSNIILKQPAVCWGHNARKVDGAKVTTVLEVAWAGASVQDLERALALWTSSQRNAIVFKIWWKGREGNKAALSEELPGSREGIAEWLKHASILFMTQGAQDPFKRVWRIGQPAEAIRLRDPDRTVEMGQH
jgi:hypothetical protein